MSNKNNGGPAFPIPGLHHDSDFNGATLRDYFAAKALPLCPCNAYKFESVAEWAYQMADAMLKERDK